MATPRKPAPDPLKEELPPATDPKPDKAYDVKFEVQIVPYIISGQTLFRWVILDHNHKGYVGDYSGHQDAGYESETDAEGGAELYVDRIRHAVDLKLNAPDSYTITL